jgi:hypothetical protein
MHDYQEFLKFLKIEDLSILIVEYAEWIKIAPGITEKRFYCGKDEYSHHVSMFAHEKLHESGFVNGEPKANTLDLNPLAAFWWNIMQTMHGYCYPLFDHHASTQECQENDLLKLKCVLNYLKGKKTDLKTRGKIKRFYDYSPSGTKNQIFCVYLATKTKIFMPK